MASEDPRPIENCYWVEPGRFLAGEYPRNRDGEAVFAKLDALTAAGVCYDSGRKQVSLRGRRITGASQ